jgi:hypothetical protein
MDHRRRALWALVILACMALLLAPAVWNGFPLLQYDTGGYLAPWFDHLLAINRPVPYGLLLVAGRWPDFWPVLIVQSALTVWVLALTLRAHRIGQRPLLLLGIVAALCVLTTLPWLTTILLTDIFAGLAVLAFYLLLLRDDALKRSERIGLSLLVAYSAATHSGTLAVLLALAAAAALVRLIDSKQIPLTRLCRGALALTLGVVIMFASNLFVTGHLGWSRGGFALSFGRMLEDGIVKRYLDDHCPDPTLRLCTYKDLLPKDADDFLWGGGVFDKLGRFAGMDDEMRRIVLGALADYPGQQLKSALTETAKQLTMVDTGAGVVNWVWNTYETIETFVPAAVPAMKAARQQRTGISFTAVNLVQVPVAWFAMALLPFIAGFALRRTGLHDIGEFAAAMALAILANAVVFGTLATAHNRYGARIVWIAGLVALIALVRLVLNRSRGEAPGLPP